ncbi:MAG TPA: sucrase ferredoxin [Chloroflexota bacterium]|nr:sucrase ferredoxin [Chloroflexota bacterium]
MAGGVERYIIMELAPPWAPQLWESPRFPPALAPSVMQAWEQCPQTLRFLCIAPDEAHTVPGWVRFLAFWRPYGAAATFERQEFLVPQQEAVPLAQCLLQGAPADLLDFQRYRADPPGAPPVRDILVCTHGSVDACCATFGYPLYHLLRRRYGVPSGGRLRAWRVSHFGGHRLAPTLIDFPEGRYWGHMTASAIDGLVRRNVPVTSLRRHYRGWGGLQTPFEQVAEREAFVREGWAWIDYLKTGHLLEGGEGGDRARVRLDFRSADGSVRGAYDVTVEVRGTVPAVHCREGGEPWRAKQYTTTSLIKNDLTHGG